MTILKSDKLSPVKLVNDFKINIEYIYAPVITAMMKSGPAGLISELSVPDAMTRVPVLEVAIS